MAPQTASILVIDDEVGMREGCRRALVPHGYQVSIAEHGVEGLRLLREESFDMVLLDAMMPGMSGLELLERIHEQDPDIVCVMITGYATVDLAARAMKQGAQDFLPKPFTTDELLMTVERGLEERKTRLRQRQREQQADESEQLERARQDMAKLDAIQSRFMLVIAHELRDPAGVIKNYLQLMRGGYITKPEWGEYLEKLDGRATQLLHMLDDILELAHLKESGSSTGLIAVDAADALEAVARRLEPVAKSKGVQLQVSIQARPEVRVRPAHLKSLWTNLIENAIQYTPGGQVSITLLEKEDRMVSTVADTGIGMSTDELARIFQEFYRTEPAQNEVPFGTGLGLSIVDQIVRNYEGSLEVDSAAGQGSTFTFALPVALTDSS
jgi:signal transduction histidine kinase